jgi:hypothetical protein
MASVDDRQTAGPPVAMGSGDNGGGNQEVRFTSAPGEERIRSLLAKGGPLKVRVSIPTDEDVEGHVLDSATVLARVALDDDDVEGHAISIHFPDVDQARHFRNALLAAGVLTATVALGAGAGAVLAPSHQGSAVGSSTQTTVFMDTSALAREGGTIAASRSLSIPVGSASDLAAKAGEAASVGAASANAATKAREGGPIGASAATTNPAASAAAAQTAAGLHGSLAGSATDTANPTASAAAAETSAGLHGSLAGSATDTANPTASAAAAQTAAGLHGSLAGSATDTANVRDGVTLSSGLDEDPTPHGGSHP